MINHKNNNFQDCGTKYFGYKNQADGVTDKLTNFHGNGGYCGVGPKNYIKSDEHLHQEVCNVLNDDPDIDASNIEVTVNKGIVNLQGIVESKIISRLIKYCIKNLTGVKDVLNNLAIKKLN